MKRVILVIGMLLAFGARVRSLFGTGAKLAVPAVLGATGSFILTSHAYSQVIATCANPEGYANYHYHGLAQKKDSGFIKDRISDGLTTLQRLSDGSYDVLFVDVRKQVISFKNDGAKILLLHRGSNDATFLVAVPGTVIELYTFYIDADGVKRFDFLQSKGGDGMLVHKSAVMTGLCSELNLQWIK
jgi:hypothetical protein